MQLIRFQRRAGDTVATVSGDWWHGGQAMSDSQVYPKTFGMAVSSIDMACFG